MHKRLHDPEDTSRPPKRPKHDAQPPEEIHFARQLSDLLVFRQDGIQQLRTGISSFKAFLESILYHREEEIRARQLSILREYLESQKPADVKDLDRPFLGQLWQAWSFANQNNNDYLASAVAAIIALLAKTLSGLLDLREHGYLLCRTVLQHQHLRLIKRGLNAPKHKDFVISPCLRLLTEVVSFDGGQLAREVYKRREETFDTNTLRRNLGLSRTDTSTDGNARRKASVRTTAVRYVLAHLKYQDTGDKSDILRQRPICGALFHHLRDDPTDLILEILRTSEQNVLKDDELQRSAKASILVVQTLERVAEVATRSERDDGAPEAAFQWLKAICTNYSYGILRPSGWYPPETTAVPETHAQDATIQMGLDSLTFYDRKEHTIRNTVLLSWVQTLRPQSSLKERELVLACFESAPELVAAYFSERNMQLEPKLSNTWIGYASFLFEIVKLSVPKYAGNVDGDSFAQLPPQTNIVMDSALPRPLTQKVLTRCLNQSSDLITFFAVRIMVLAFQKMAVVHEQLKEGAAVSDHPGLWTEAIDRLQSTFSERSPSMKDVIAAYRKLPDDQEHLAQREATARLMRLYFEVTPLEALEEHFDISTQLTTILLKSEQQSSDGLRTAELEHLLAIARLNPSMRWFNKQGSLRFSPIVTLLNIHSKDCQRRSIRELLGAVLTENSVLSATDPTTRPSPLDILVASISNEPSEAVFDFLGDCCSRISRGPIKYQDDLDELAGSKAKMEDQPGLLMAAVAEQAAFAIQRPEGERDAIFAWVRRLFDLHDLLGTSGKVLSKLRKGLAVQGVWTSTKTKSGKRDKLMTADGDHNLQKVFEQVLLPDTKVIPVAAEDGHEEQTLPFGPIPVEANSHPEIMRWQNKDLDIAVEDGDVGALMLCLCSMHAEIRIQAHAQLRSVTQRIEASTVEDKQQLHLLIGEFLETYDQQSLLGDAVGGDALPYIAGLFASRALDVQTDPAHVMYGKLNSYLIRGPSWNVRSLPSYWVRNTILARPEESTAYWKEVQWVLEWLVDGLRTPADLRLVLRPEVMERLLALYSSPSASTPMVRMKVLELLYRAACIDANALVTRVGVLAWLDIVKDQGAIQIPRLLRDEIKRLANSERLSDWAGLDVAIM